jgi:protease IV
MDNRQLTRLIVGAVAVLVIFAIAIALIALSMSRDGAFFGPSGDKIGLVRIQGVIVDSRQAIAHLEHFAHDSRVKAIVVRIDSPGGGVAASQEIYEAVKRLREENKKTVVVSMGSVAASGGYYVACGADYTFANPGTITGSIGVIAEWYNYGDLLDWAHLKPEVIKSGALKDIGSGTRPMTDVERAQMQSLVDRLFGQFLGVVVAARGGKKDLSADRIRELADGRVFTGDEAVDLGFVDALGDERAAVLYAAKAVSIEGEPTVVEPPAERAVTILDLLTKTDVSEVAARGLPTGAAPSGASVQFGYVWK